MAYRKIPKKFDWVEIAKDVKIAVLFREDAGQNPVAVISEITGLKPRSVYGYLSGETKIDLDFLHAAHIATGGDHEIGKYLEPDGWRLDPADWPAPDKTNLAGQYPQGPTRPDLFPRLDS